MATYTGNLQIVRAGIKSFKAYGVSGSGCYVTGLTPFYDKTKFDVLINGAVIAQNQWTAGVLGSGQLTVTLVTALKEGDTYQLKSNATCGGSNTFETNIATTLPQRTYIGIPSGVFGGNGYNANSTNVYTPAVSKFAKCEARTITAHNLGYYRFGFSTESNAATGSINVGRLTINGVAAPAVTSQLVSQDSATYKVFGYDEAVTTDTFTVDVSGNISGNNNSTGDSSGVKVNALPTATIAAGYTDPIVLQFEPAPNWDSNTLGGGDRYFALDFVLVKQIQNPGSGFGFEIFDDRTAVLFQAITCAATDVIKITKTPTKYSVTVNTTEVWSLNRTVQFSATGGALSNATVQSFGSTVTYTADVNSGTNFGVTALIDNFYEVTSPIEIVEPIVTVSPAIPTNGCPSLNTTHTVTLTQIASGTTVTGIVSNSGVTISDVNVSTKTFKITSVDTDGGNIVLALSCGNQSITIPVGGCPVAPANDCLNYLGELFIGSYSKNVNAAYNYSNIVGITCSGTTTLSVRNKFNVGVTIANNQQVILQPETDFVGTGVAIINILCDNILVGTKTFYATWVCGTELKCNKPSVDDLKEGDTTISGSTCANGVVEITRDGVLQGSATANSAGNYTFTLSSALTKFSIVEAAVTCSDCKKSDTTKKVAKFSCGTSTNCDCDEIDRLLKNIDLRTRNISLQLSDCGCGTINPPCPPKKPNCNQC